MFITFSTIIRQFFPSFPLLSRPEQRSVIPFVFISPFQVVGESTVIVYDDYYDQKQINKNEINLDVVLNPKENTSQVDGKEKEDEKKKELVHTDVPPSAASPSGNPLFSVLATEVEGEMQKLLHADGANVVEIPQINLSQFLQYVKQATYDPEPLESFLTYLMKRKEDADHPEPTAPPALYVDDYDFEEGLKGGNAKKEENKMEIVQPMAIQRTDLSYLTTENVLEEQGSENVKWVELVPETQ
jgi:hypothetical protein